MLALVAVGELAATAAAEVDSGAEMRSLDEQVQEIKSDVLGIASELQVLEERLLFPSNTQVTVFMSLGEAEDFRLDAVKLEIDGEPAAHHIYSFKELEALQQGGVQRLFMGNLPAGVHELQVAVLGKLPNGESYSRAETFSFDKRVAPSLLGLTVEPVNNDTSIDLKVW